jgi:hypothetical protein
MAVVRTLVWTVGKASRRSRPCVHTISGVYPGIRFKLVDRVTLR